MLVRERISIERRKQGMSVSDLALAIGVNKGSISRYENGYVKTIPVDVLRRISDTLHMNFDEIVSDDPQYCMLSSQHTTNQKYIHNELSVEEEKLVKWYRKMPHEVKDIIKQIYSLEIKSS